ncbi:uncharacterized protein LOC133411745 [Phycodurus eques]|uniref:uncharacterized protein LOC133411745 n=1 Tax=Phycodurus eques TaxID=693459 RepID=UPI002ACEAAB9|nr:uncharacterized protein LOC133411745 [Phycodurus eques]
MEAEAAWRRTESSLQCGPKKMILKVTGLEAANLELNLGTGRNLPLSELSESCGYLLHQNALGLVLVVPYDGCNVIQENGYYVLPMSFLETSVTLSCPIAPALTPQDPFPRIPLTIDLSKRDADQASSSNDPYHQYQHYHNYLKYLYYLHIINNPHMYPFVHRTYNPLYQKSEPLSHGYPHLPVHYPLYARYQQNPAAPYCHPPGALCPLPHFPPYYHHYPHQSPPKQDKTVDPTKAPTMFTTKPTPLATTQIPTRKLCRSTTTAAAPTTRTMTTTTTTIKQRCRPRTPPQSKKLTPYSNNPFAQEILYTEGSPFPGDPKGAPHAGSNSGPLLNYQDWQHEPWFPQEEDEGIPFDWDDLEP